MATIDVATHNGHDHHDCKQLLIDDLKKRCEATTRVSKELGHDFHHHYHRLLAKL